MITIPDYYNIDSLLSEEERLIRDTVRSFVDSEIIPIIEDHYQAGTAPEGMIKRLGEMGMLGPTIPEEYGGAGLNSVCYGLIAQELERGDSAIRSTASVQSSLVMFPIYKFGSEDLKRKWLPLLASGDAVGCFGLTEPDFGSNPNGMLTNAVETDKGYLLNGAKMWITNGSLAHVAVVWAKLNGEIRGFIVEKGTPGFTAPIMKNKHSLRASVTSELIFQDCEIPKENMFQDIKGLKGPLQCLSQARFGISWGAIGAALAVFESSVKYATTRIQFDRPIGGFQLIQDKLVWMLNEITKAQLLSYQLGRMKDNNTWRPQQVSLAKRNNVWMALECARLARDIHGANGILSEYPIMRHANNLESVKTYEGTHDIHTLIIGQDITGLDAFK
ncbi:MAG: acyl-CoA dehydrogenase family protein [Chlorobiota bacterium]|jgi:glutaryl-CoA dehydrogenase|nr:acyl-CoA dehydrogenase family protein [Chlorobiota bacterium]QQS65809.1 MAG: acyl-CoA dehydrogenase family protein [Chlorobiota bacterium]